MATITITASNNRVAASTGDVVLLPLIGDNVTSQVWITVSGSVTLRPSGTDKIDGTQGDATITSDSQYTNTGSSSWYLVNPYVELPTNSVTTNTDQTITGVKTMTGANVVTHATNGVIIQDSNASHTVRLVTGNQTVNANLNIPVIPTEDTVATSWAANTFQAMNVFNAQVNFAGNTYIFNDKLLLANSATSQFTTVTSPTQSGSYKLTVPLLAGDTNFLTTSAATNQVVTTGFLVTNGSFILYKGGADGVRVQTSSSQSGVATLETPVLADSSTNVIQVGFSLTSSAMVAGTVTIVDSRFKTGDVVQCTRKSGAGASTGLKSVTIVDSTSCTLEANSATDDGIWYVTVTKP